MRGFWVLLGFLLLFYGVLLGQHWVPVHDTLSSLNIFHVLLQHWVTFGTPALWIPTINHGFPTHGFHLLTISPGSYFLLPWAFLFDSVNSVIFFYLGMFFNELLLLGGTYLLARECFKSQLTFFFVTLSVLGTVVWMRQSFLNFGNYYFLPLCMHLALLGVKRRQIKWGVLSLLVYLFFLSHGFGGYPCLPAGLILIVFSLVLWWWPITIESVGPQPIRFRRYWFFAGILLVAFALAVCFFLIRGELAFHAPQRQGLTSDYSNFLSYQRYRDQFSIAQIVFGIYSYNDSIAYGGLLIPPLALFSTLLVTGRVYYVFLICAVFLFLFAMGSDSFVAPLVYYLPGLSHFRHLGHTAALFRVFLIFLGGFGFDALVTGSNKSVRWRLAIGFLLVVFLIFLWRFATSYAVTPVLTANRIRLVLCLLGAALISCLIPIIRKEWTGHLPILLLMIGAIDVLSFRSFVIHKELLPISEEIWKSFSRFSFSFEKERVLDYVKNDAFRKWGGFLKGNTHLDESGLSRCILDGKGCIPVSAIDLGQVNDSFDAMLGLDPCLSIFRSDFSIKNIFAVKQAFHLPVDSFHPLEQFSSPAVRKAFRNAGFRRMIGCEYPKIQLHRSARVVASDTELLAQLVAPGFQGTPLLLSEAGNAALQDFATKTNPNDHQAAVLDAKYQVPQYTFNRFRVVLDTPTKEPLWLYYASAWAAGWQAEVNGKFTPLIRSHYGYQAVPLPAGSQEISFSYKPRFLKFLIWANLFFNFLVVGGLLGWIFCACHFGRKSDEPGI